MEVNACQQLKCVFSHPKPLQKGDVQKLPEALLQPENEAQVPQRLEL